MDPVSRRRALVAAIGVAALALVACSKTIDQDKLQTTIKDKVAAEQGITLTSVSCPKDQKAKNGDTFECTATTEDGQTVTFQVTQTSGSGDVTYNSKDIVVPGDAFTTSLQSALSSSAGTSVTVDCPKAVVLPGGNGDLVCNATTASGDKAKITIPVKDGQPQVADAKVE